MLLEQHPIITGTEQCGHLEFLHFTIPAAAHRPVCPCLHRQQFGLLHVPKVALRIPSRGLEVIVAERVHVNIIHDEPRVMLRTILSAHSQETDPCSIAVHADTLNISYWLSVNLNATPRDWAVLLCLTTGYLPHLHVPICGDHTQVVSTDVEMSRLPMSFVKQQCLLHSALEVANLDSSVIRAKHRVFVNCHCGCCCGEAGHHTGIPSAAA
mmetsp:Transcript_20369/g.24458  ORF Transcript_20369/g.24458 Transcript_20369/m.24458 type:complete len:211 (-) Transcript_20369:1360-1992(-)